MAFGNLYQLAPVCQKFVFEDAADLFARLAGSVWQDNFQFAELDEILRQKDDRAFAELLNRIRVGENLFHVFFFFFLIPHCFLLFIKLSSINSDFLPLLRQTV